MKKTAQYHSCYHDFWSVTRTRVHVLVFVFIVVHGVGVHGFLAVTCVIAFIVCMLPSFLLYISHNAKSLHVALDILAAELVDELVRAADTRLQLRRLLLPAENVYAVLASLRAASAPEHGVTKEIVILQRLSTLCVGSADPPGLSAGDDSVQARREEHGIAAGGVDSQLGAKAGGVPSAIALRGKS